MFVSVECSEYENLFTFNEHITSQMYILMLVYIVYTHFIVFIPNNYTYHFYICLISNGNTELYVIVFM